MKINTTIFLTIISFFYSVLLMIAYFSKDKIKTLENKVYSKLIIINFIGIILELFCTIFAGYAKDYLVFYTILNKLFLVELTIWCSVFSVYVFLISSKKEKNELKSYLKKVSIFHIVIDVITMFLIFVLPVQFNINDLGYVMYSYGPSVNIVFISSTLYIILMFTCLIRNFKNIKNKKYLPIYVYMVIGVLVGIVQKLHPEILAFTSMEAFITVIMYFTIENPDKKLLEEIHTSKKIADAANEDKSMLIYNMMNEVKSIASDINKSSEVILNSNNLEENRFFAREIISSNNKLYGIPKNVYNRTLYSLIASNPLSAIDQFIELGCYRYILSNFSYVIKRPDDLMFYRIVKAKQLGDPIYSERRTQNIEFLGKISNDSKNGYGINRSNKQEVVSQYVPSFNPMYDEVVNRDRNAGSIILASNNYFITAIEEYKVDDLRYDFNGVIISRFKVLRIYETLIKNRIAGTYNAILYAICKNSILTEEQYRNITACLDRTFGNLKGVARG